jgi:YbbR domain-containing protein
MTILRRNFGYKFLSLIISILLYWIASGQRNNPSAKGDFYVQPVVEGLPANMVLKNPPQGSSVSVSGPPAAVEAFRALEPKAIVNLSGAKVGADRYPIKYLYPNGFANSLEIIGPPVTLATVEQKQSSKFFVDVLYNDHPPAGYVYSDAKSNPPAVQVTGLNSDVSRVSRVVANLDTDGLPGAISQDVELVAQDLKQQPVENVQIIPKQVRATLGLKKTPSTKTVLLSIDLTGTPSAGYEISEYKFLPQTVTISGSQELLASRSSLSVPVDVDGIKSNVTRMVTIQPPSGLHLVEGNNPVKLILRVKATATTSPAPTATPTVAVSVPPTATPPPMKINP